MAENHEKIHIASDFNDVITIEREIHDIAKTWYNIESNALILIEKIESLSIQLDSCST